MTPSQPAGPPVHLVVMGVSGSGKSTVAQALKQRLGWKYAEGDDFHPAANVEKMADGQALTDEDRWPWLHSLAQWTREQDEQGRSTVLACSALRRAYRDILRGGGEGTAFVHVHGDTDLLRQRMQSREHFMPASLLKSQLDTLEPLQSEEVGAVFDIAEPPERIASQAITFLDLN